MKASYRRAETAFKGKYGRVNQYVVYGLMKCWSKISQTRCKSCIFEGSQELRRRWPYHQGAIIWYDNCLLKYSNQNFLGLNDTINGVYLTNYKFVFDQKVGQLLTKLCSHAYDSDFKVAHGELETGILHYCLIYGAA